MSPFLFRCKFMLVILLIYSYLILVVLIAICKICVKNYIYFLSYVKL